MVCASGGMGGEEFGGLWEGEEFGALHCVVVDAISLCTVRMYDGYMCMYFRLGLFLVRILYARTGEWVGLMYAYVQYVEVWYLPIGRLRLRGLAGCRGS